MIAYKHGVDHEHLHPVIKNALPAMLYARERALMAARRNDMVITSGAEGAPGDGVHGANSWHYKGLAVDLRTQDFVALWAQELKDSLGEGWDIVIERDHIHVERDARKKPL